MAFYERLQCLGACGDVRGRAVCWFYVFIKENTSYFIQLLSVSIWDLVKEACQLLLFKVDIFRDGVKLYINLVH